MKLLTSAVKHVLRGGGSGIYILSNQIKTDD